MPSFHWSFAADAAYLGRTSRRFFRPYQHHLLSGDQNAHPDKNLAGLMTPDGIAVMNVYAAMIKYASVYRNTPTTNNATFQAFNPFNWRQDIARLDWRPADKDSLYFRYLHDNYKHYRPVWQLRFLRVAHYADAA